LKSVAIIPAYNEEKTIGTVVKQTLQYVDEVIVMDDHCTDNTREEALKAGAMVRSTSSGKGAGKAIRIGIGNAINIYQPDAIVLLDGDGQHNPDDIPSMLSLLKDFDMIVTSRFMDNSAFTNMPKYRKFGIQCINFAYNFGAKFKIRDSQCGLRAFRANVLRDMNLQENGFGYSVEMLVKARAKGYKIIEIPTVVHYHKDFKQNSSMNPVIHGLGVLLVTLKWRLICEVFKCNK
jgi:glycosyltransferase involved in cell wall biosynthesis